MPQPVAQRAEPADGVVQRRRARRQRGAIDPGRTVLAEHGRDLVQREAGHAAERDQRQAIEHVRVEQAAQATPPDGGDQALVLVVTQGGGGQAGAPRDFRDIQVRHGLDLKST